MRFRFDSRKSRRLRANPRRGIGFEEAQEVFAHPYYLDQRADLPQQYRAIGWALGRLYTVIFEVREARQVSTSIWSRSGRPLLGSSSSMKKTRKAAKPVPAEAIARIAERGKDVSRYFTNHGRMMEPIQRVNVDFTATMLRELDSAAGELNVSRQAVIKTLLRQALGQHYLAEGARHKAG